MILNGYSNINNGSTSHVLWLYKDGVEYDASGGWSWSGYSVPDSRISYVNPVKNTKNFKCYTSTDNVYSICGTSVKVDTTVNVKSAIINNNIPINIGNTIKLSDNKTLTYTQSQTNTTGLILIYEDPTKTNY